MGINIISEYKKIDPYLKSLKEFVLKLRFL